MFYLQNLLIFKYNFSSLVKYIGFSHPLYFLCTEYADSRCPNWTEQLKSYIFVEIFITEAFFQITLVL